MSKGKIEKKLRILDLGCGKKKREGAIGVDFSDRHTADVIHDLNVSPYPFNDEEFDEVYHDNVLEHLKDPIRVLEEVYRIFKPRGTVKVITPYFRSVWACINLTHKHFFTVDSFAYFDPHHPICLRYDYTLARFSVDKIVFNETLKNGLMKKIIVLLANIYPRIYKYYFSHFYPLDDITY